MSSNMAHSLSGKRDSNPRPSAWEANALPPELFPLVSMGKDRKLPLICNDQSDSKISTAALDLFKV
jgi:hypothetical protein